MPRQAAIEQLEAGLPERVRARVEAFEERHPRGQPSAIAAYAVLDALRAAVADADEPAARSPTQKARLARTDPLGRRSPTQPTGTLPA